MAFRGGNKSLSPSAESADPLFTSGVEKHFLALSGERLRYEPDEKLGVITVNNFPDLGRLAALRFLEWVIEHPDGVISLPTGRTPEYFIKEVRRILSGWDDPAVRAELEEVGLGGRGRPDLRGLRFAQIDEFYPMNPLHHNSFYAYVNRFYIDGFGLDPRKALFINCEKIGLPAGMGLEEVWPEDEVDLSLRYRSPRGDQERLQSRVLAGIDQWCGEYEDRIRDMGGIGFFLGGIGPDGHIGFNIRGSDLHSTTRLSAVNYETQAAAASDLGGIEVARKRLVITIGLATISYNPECSAVIMAAGEAKKTIVAEAIRSPRHVLCPPSALQLLPRARFYITRGASGDLTARRSLRGAVDEIIRRTRRWSLSSRPSCPHTKSARTPGHIFKWAAASATENPVCSSQATKRSLNVPWLSMCRGSISVARSPAIICLHLQPSFARRCPASPASPSGVNCARAASRAASSASSSAHKRGYSLVRGLSSPRSRAIASSSTSVIRR